jgi:hypothetical protein
LRIYTGRIPPSLLARVDEAIEQSNPWTDLAAPAQVRGTGLTQFGSAVTQSVF